MRGWRRVLDDSTVQMIRPYCTVGRCLVEAKAIVLALGSLAPPKRGLFTLSARPWVGELHLADISVPEQVYRRLGLTVGPIFARTRVITSLFTYVAGKHSQPDSAPPVPLTAREEQILALMADSLSNREIVAAAVFATPDGQELVHVIFQKLDVHDRLQFLRLIKPTRP